MDLTTATPVEIDTALADLYGKEYRAQQTADMAWGDVNHQVKRTLGLSYRQSFSSEQYDQVIEQARNLGEHPAYEDREAFRTWALLKDVAEALEQVDKYRDQIADLQAQMRPFEAEFARRGGWTRFFSVQGGHIHSSMACSTCNKMGKATHFGWLPEWSGQSEEQALEALVTKSRKTVLCTVCFPSAPVAWTVEREDESACPGSGTFDYPRETARLGYYSGNYGVCEHCGQRATVTSTGKMRKHKKEA